MPTRSPGCISSRSGSTCRTSSKTLKAKTDLTELEKGFIAAAKTYGERKGITHAAWRALGVPADVLRKAGIGRGV